MMSAPVRRIDEILALPHSAEDFKGQDVHPSDDDSWLYNGEDELNSALQERQKELELYNSELRDKKKSKESQDTGSSSGKNLDDFDLGGLAKTMQAFVHKVSSYKGAEVPENRLVYLYIHWNLLHMYSLIVSTIARRTLTHTQMECKIFLCCFCPFFYIEQT